MAKFPITAARQELGFTPTTAVRADIDVRQADVGGAVGQALVAGAGLLLESQQRADLIEADTQLSASLREANTIENEINDIVARTQDTSAESFGKISENIVSRIEALRPPNEKAARAFDRRLATRIPQINETIENSRLIKVETNFLAEGDALLNDVERTGRALPYLTWLQKARILNIEGFRSEEELRPRKQVAVNIAAESRIRIALNAGDIEEAERLLEGQRVLTPDQEASAQRAIDTKVAEDARLAKETRRLEEETAELEVYTASREGTLSETLLREKSEQLNKFDRRFYAGVIDAEVATAKEEQVKGIETEIDKAINTLFSKRKLDEDVLALMVQSGVIDSKQSATWQTRLDKQRTRDAKIQVDKVVEANFIDDIKALEKGDIEGKKKIRQSLLGALRIDKTIDETVHDDLFALLEEQTDPEKSKPLDRPGIKRMHVNMNALVTKTIGGRRISGTESQKIALTKIQLSDDIDDYARENPTPNAARDEQFFNNLVEPFVKERVFKSVNKKLLGRAERVRETERATTKENIRTLLGQGEEIKTNNFLEVRENDKGDLMGYNGIEWVPVRRAE